MIDREQLINEIAEVVNRNSMEKAFNDTPDFILARIAVEAMEMFTRASAHRDDYHGFRTADYDRKYKAICESEKKAKPVNTCKGCPLIDVCPAVQMENQPERKWEYKKPEAHNIPKEVVAMAAFFADMFPSSEIQIQRVDLKRTPGTNAGQRINGKEGDAMKNKCSSEIPNMPTECAPDNRRPEKICGTCRYFNPEFPVNGKPAPVCLAIKEMKGGTEYTNPRGTQHYFRCSNGRYENGIGQ